MTDINTLQNIGEDINRNYDILKTSNIGNYVNTNVTAIPNIIQAINENLAELTLIQNQLNTTNNINQEILVKKDQLLKMKNDDLMKQLKKLEIIESNIANKDRIIEQTNYNIHKQNTNINNLIISIILAIALCILVFLYSLGRLNNKDFLILLIIIILCYLILYLYTYNIFYLKDSISYLFNARSIQSLENRLTTWSEKVHTAVKNEFIEMEQSWIENHCLCPVVEEEKVKPDVYPIDQNVFSRETPGYFYYDGTAPAQLLVPTPDPAQGLSEKIDWVDYSSNGNILYNPNTNQVSHDNKSYYNYKNTTDPIIALQKNLNNFNETAKGTSLVDSETYSTNF
jgi:hypothetical protein